MFNNVSVRQREHEKKKISSRNYIRIIIHIH